MTGLDVFDATVQKTNTWLNDLMGKLDTADRHEAYAALRSALHALRDRLTVAEAVQLGAQLPMLIRGVYYEGWNPTGKPNKWNLNEFLSAIRSGVTPRMDLDPERVARAVFAVLAVHVSEGEIRQVQHLLPKEFRHLWPMAA